MSTEMHLPVGHNLQIVDNEDDYIDNTIVTTPNISVDTSSQAEPTMSSASRYPRREHRVHSRFNDHVPLNYVSDETSA